MHHKQQRSSHAQVVQWVLDSVKQRKGKSGLVDDAYMYAWVAALPCILGPPGDDGKVTTTTEAVVDNFLQAAHAIDAIRAVCPPGTVQLPNVRSIQKRQEQLAVECQTNFVQHGLRIHEPGTSQAKGAAFVDVTVYRRALPSALSAAFTSLHAAAAPEHSVRFGPRHDFANDDDRATKFLNAAWYAAAFEVCSLSPIRVRSTLSLWLCHLIATAVRTCRRALEMPLKVASTGR